MSRRTLADELLFLGLYDEAAAELAAARQGFRRGGREAAGVRPPPAMFLPTRSGPLQARRQTRATPCATASRSGSAVPADYLLELPPRERSSCFNPAPTGMRSLSTRRRAAWTRASCSPSCGRSRASSPRPSRTRRAGLLAIIPSTADQMPGSSASPTSGRTSSTARASPSSSSPVHGPTFSASSPDAAGGRGLLQRRRGQRARWVARARSATPTATSSNRLSRSRRSTSTKSFPTTGVYPDALHGTNSNAAEHDETKLTPPSSSRFSVSSWPLPVAAARAGAAGKRFELTGQVLSVDKAQQTATIKHEKSRASWTR